MTELLTETRMISLAGQRVRATRWRAARPGDAPPLLFLNGLGANSEMLSPFVRRLATRDVVTFDAPGIGGSPAPILPYLACFIARLAEHVLQEFGYERADVLGYSWGGAMAQQLAVQSPGVVNRVILVATGATVPIIPGDLSAISGMLDPFRFVDPAFALRAMIGGGKTASVRGIGRFQAPSAIGMLYQILAVAGWTSMPLLSLVRKDMMVMMGSDDAVAAPVNGAMIKLLVPSARLEVIEGGDHLFLLNRAEETVPLIEDFLGV